MSITDGNDVQCDFESRLNESLLVTTFYNIDHGRSPTKSSDIVFSYPNMAGLQKLIGESMCYQSVEQLCQPWIQLLYELDESIVKESKLPGWKWDHIHACTCFKYHVPLVPVVDNTTDFPGYVYCSL